MSGDEKNVLGAIEAGARGYLLKDASMLAGSCARLNARNREYGMTFRPSNPSPIQASVHLSRGAVVAIAIGFAVLTAAIRGDAVQLGVEFVDSAGDQAGAIDWVSVRLQFDDQSGAYAIRLLADPSAPFQGDLRVNVILVNPDTDVFALDPSLFADVSNDLSIASLSQLIVLTGISQKLIAWDVGDQVGTTQIPFGSPPGGPSEFRTALFEQPGLVLSDELTSTSVQSLALAPASPVADPLALPGSVRIDWTQLGGVFTAVANPSVVSVDASLSATVSKASAGDLERRNQCALGEPFGTCGSNSNFAPGEPLLFTNFAAGPVRIEFSEPVMGVGAQLTSNEFAPYTAVVEAFGSAGESLGFAVQAGVGSNAADDSAAFVGIQTPSNAIRAVEFDVASGRSEFVLNGLWVLRSSPVPALSAWGVPVLIAILLLFAALLIPRRRTC